MACRQSGESQNATTWKIKIKTAMWVNSLWFHQNSLNIPPPPTPLSMFVAPHTDIRADLVFWPVIGPCMTLHDLWPPVCLLSFHEAVTQKEVPRGIHYGLHLAGRTSHDKCASILDRWSSWSGSCAADLFRKVLCISQYYPGRWRR